MSWLGGSSEEPKPATMGGEVIADPHAVRRVERQGTIERVETAWKRDDLDDDERERQLKDADKVTLTPREVHGLHPLDLDAALEGIENAYGRVIAADDGVLIFQIPANLAAPRRREIVHAVRVLDAARPVVWRRLRENKPLPKGRTAAAGGGLA